MNDETKEQLELAAKAAGYEVARIADDGRGLMLVGVQAPWNPRDDDGDALRLAVACGISLTPYPIYREYARHSVIAKQRRGSDSLRENNPTEVVELYGDDSASAWRRAIFRAAVAIGWAMP